jgi:hypothetical protein
MPQESRDSHSALNVPLERTIQHAPSPACIHFAYTWKVMFWNQSSSESDLMASAKDTCQQLCHTQICCPLAAVYGVAVFGIAVYGVAVYSSKRILSGVVRRWRILGAMADLGRDTARSLQGDVRALIEKALARVSLTYEVTRFGLGILCWVF